MGKVMAGNNLIKYIYSMGRETYWYALHKIKGTTYAAYYADRMDRIVKKNPQWGLNLKRRFQLDYLISQGMEPHHKMLDFGCGAMSAGVHFIAYLDSGCYYGVDVSAKVLEEGIARLKERDLWKKEPSLHKFFEDDILKLRNVSFDFIWAQSVFTHMPPEDIERLVCNLSELMTPNSVFFATFAEGEKNSRQVRYKDWLYSKDFFVALGERCHLDINFMDDWHHVQSDQYNDVLVRMRLK